ncbi:unnamed protein product [Calypogeia fissa]
MAEKTLRDPFLAHQNNQQQQQRRRRRGTPESVAGRLLAASSGFVGQSFARQRTIARRQSAIDCQDPGRAYVGNILSRIASPFVEFYNRFVEEFKFFSLPAKAGLAASICSLLCFAPEPLTFLNKNGMWAVITADICIGPNVGVTLYKGLNRALGTLAASGLAYGIDYMAPMFGNYQPAWIIFWTFLGAAVLTMFKFRRPFKDRWNYAVAMSIITLHILILNTSGYEDKIKLPMIRMVTIVIGFCTASLVNLCVAPKYAGDTINELVAKNFERAGNVMERCVYAYCDGMVLEQVPDIRAGKSEDDNIHTSFHEIVAADAEVVRLLQAVPYEPCHGKFFVGYPWRMYEGITEMLRNTLFDVAALDSCLRAEIQAPPHIRSIFEEELQSIGRDCAQFFRMIGAGIGEMRQVHCLHIIQQTEEGALVLQHKISKYITSELDAIQSMEPTQAQDAYEESINIAFRDAYDDELFASPKGYFRTHTPHVERSDSSSSTENVKIKGHHLAEGHEDFLQRRESMSRHWNTTVQRISILSPLYS